MPPYAGAGATPLYPIGGSQSNQPHTQTTPGPSVPAGPTPPYMSPTGPQTPVPVYAPHIQTESPELVARCELAAVNSQLHNQTTILNHRLNEPGEINVETIEQLQEDIRRLETHRDTLTQRLQDLQDPNSYAFAQANTPLMYAHGPAVESGLNRLGWNQIVALAATNQAKAFGHPDAKKREPFLKSRACKCLYIVVIAGAILIASVIFASKHHTSSKTTPTPTPTPTLTSATTSSMATSTSMSTTSSTSTSASPTTTSTRL
ncbi:hypothetical protein H072_507 [Dactylellina haptotyla CBS 200.50]|uniref:Uncharacterized protein n=1 Tax=Dactylellina haptotyla (strain CBS 200.50) TaxID=1284197 RepID=S8AWW4_DACHA|nr:hypothetical protein H072_507 [Dactylellina haptotyla CBS 200.50]